HACLAGDLPADDVVRVEITDDPAAAVKEDERGKDALTGSIESEANRPRGTVGLEIANVTKRRHGRTEGGTRVAVLLASFRRRDPVHRRKAEASEVVDGAARLWV